jgi:hypothetical protein
VKNLNVGFDQFKIFFKYRGADKIQNNAFHDLVPDSNVSFPGATLVTDVLTQAANESILNNSAINIFIVHYLWQNNSDPSNPAQFATLPGIEGGSNPPGVNTKNIFVTFQYAKYVLQHEMGHIFGLGHPNEHGISYPQTGANCEHVKRPDPLDGPDVGNVNCNSAGDYICDTYASPAIYEDTDVDGSGVYVGHAYDCIDDLLYITYDGDGIPKVPIKNFMNVNREEDIHFQNSFTTGQGSAMRYAIDNLYPSAYAVLETPLEELYQPFQTIGHGGHVISVTDTDNPAIALVCRNYVVDNRFQEGFDYIFPIYDEFGQPAGPSTSAGITEIPVISDRTTDFPVIIAQVSSDAIKAKLSCTKEKVCDEESYVSGHLYSMQVLGTMNITVEELTKIQVTDPELYDKLMSQYYYILKKMTESGAIKEDTFYKP